MCVQSVEPPSPLTRLFMEIPLSSGFPGVSWRCDLGMSVIASLSVAGLGHGCTSDGTKHCLGVQERLGVIHAGAWKPSTNNSRDGRGI